MRYLNGCRVERASCFCVCVCLVAYSKSRARRRPVLNSCLQFVYERAFRKVFGARPLQATPAPPLAGPGHGQGVARDKDRCAVVCVRPCPQKPLC